MADGTYLNKKTLTEKELVAAILAMTLQQRTDAEIEFIEEPKNVEVADPETKQLDTYLKDLVHTANNILREQIREIKTMAGAFESMMEKTVELARDNDFIDVTTASLNAASVRVTKLGPVLAKAIEAGKELQKLTEVYMEEETD